ncbi:MAG: Tripeptidyl aminopeptidase [Luteibacter sp.]|nr:MAG: Tripeptidyl aminopeptidase [Luteibacter sp.]
MDVSIGEEDQLSQGMDLRDGILINAALQPVTDAPHLYGLGTDINHLSGRLMRIPLATRVVWQMMIAEPADVLAALTLADWLKEGRMLRQIEPAIDTHRFSPSPEVDLTARDSAKRLLRALTAPMVAGTQEEAGNSSFSVTLATRCNDGAWRRRVDEWSALFRKGMSWSLSLDEADMVTALTCAQWPRRPSTAPDFTRLSLLPPVLVLNGEYDRHTPWDGAQKTMGLMRTSRAVLLRRGSGRVIDSGPSRCVEHAVSHYLLTGLAPLKKVTNCRVQRP